MSRILRNVAGKVTLLVEAFSELISRVPSGQVKSMRWPDKVNAYGLSTRLSSRSQFWWRRVHRLSGDGGAMEFICI
jgi:hypothetical protein